MIKYEDLEAINSQLKTMPIKDKDYITVNQRILGFWKLMPNGFIDTYDLTTDEERANKICRFRAEVGYVTDNDRKIRLATGHAYEKEGSTFINKSSYIENCETSAIGRAIGMLGIGISTSVASYEEVANAKLNQDNNNNKYLVEFIDSLNKLGTLEVDRHDPKFIEFVNEKAKTNYSTLDPMGIAIDDLQKVNKVLKAIIKSKQAELSKLDVKDNEPTF